MTRISEAEKMVKIKEIQDLLAQHVGQQAIAKKVGCSIRLITQVAREGDVRPSEKVIKHSPPIARVTPVPIASPLEGRIATLETKLGAIAQDDLIDQIVQLELKIEEIQKELAAVRETRQNIDLWADIRDAAKIIRSAWQNKAPNGPTMEMVRRLENFLKTQNSV